jgi:hypothetical protein
MTFNLEEYRASMEAKYGPNWKDKVREGASLGGKARVSKGIGRLSPERRAEISRLGVEARRAKNGV